METKKNPRYDLEKKRSLFMQIGFVVSLLIVLTAFEYKVPVGKVEELTMEELIETEELPPVTRSEEEKKPTPPPEIPKLTTLFEVVDDDEEIEAELELIDVEAGMDESVEIQDVKADEEDIDEEVPFVRVESMPIFRPEKNKTWEEGQRDLFSYMQSHAKYPVIAQENGIQGRVFVRFVVTKTGEVSNAQVVRGVDAALDQEALRVVNNLPRFKPGNQRGRAVSVWFSGFISFVLQ